MSKTYEEQFIFDLESIKQGMLYCGHDTNFIQIVWSLKGKIKEHYPMNAVPFEIFESLEHLENSFKQAEKQLNDTVDIIVNRIKKDEGMK